jgi:hypothetical protein
MAKRDSWWDDERAGVSALLAITAIISATALLLTFLQG